MRHHRCESREMRGQRKNKKNGFHNGNTYFKSRVWSTHHTGDDILKFKRLSQSERELLKRDGTDTDQECKVRLLRPNKLGQPSHLEQAQKYVENAESNTYRLWHVRKTQDMWNTCARHHRRESPDCLGDLVFDLSSEIQRGLAWQERLKCTRCVYVSPMHKLYEEVKSTKRGRKAATINYGLQVGLSHTAISNTSMCNILHAMNTPAPALSGMTKNANRIGDIIEETNEKDMSRIKKNIKQLNKTRGLSPSHPIDIEIDCRYNNPIYSKAGKSPFQAGTQMSQVVVENVTSKKFVIGVNNKSKLCQSCKVNMNGLTCKSHVCSANLDATASIGDEKRWTHESLARLQQNDGMTVRLLTTDPDSSTFSAAKERFESGITHVQPIHQLDTRHVGNNLRKYIKGCKFDKTMFGGRTIKTNSKLQSRFSHDLSARCHAEHVSAMRNLKNDTEKVQRALSFSKEAIIKCYSGDHDACKTHSFVCQGCKSKNWLNDSLYLDSKFKISPSDKDIDLLRKCINMRLGIQSLKKMYSLNTTQKCEAVNHAISASSPKNKTFSRNHAGRVHASIHRVNNGIGEASLVECMSAGAPITPGSRVARGMLRMQRLNHARQSAMKNIKSRTRRRQNISNIYQLYDNMKLPVKTTYKSGIELNKMMKGDHTYCKLN